MSTTRQSGTSSCPPQPRRSQQRGVKRARELLDIATKLFIANGINDTTIDDIVAHAGIAKGTFYHHYESKVALLLAIREAFVDDFDAYVEDALATQASDDSIVRLDTWVRATCEAYVLNIQRQDIAFASDGFRWTPRDQRHIKALVDLFEQGNVRGRWKVEDLYKTAVFVQRGMLGVMDDLLLAGKSLKDIHRDVLDLVHRVVGL